MNELRQLLTQPNSNHLTDEMIALLADLEAADEDIEQLYPDESAHLSQCVRCAEEHAALVEMVFAAELGVIPTVQSTSTVLLHEEFQAVWGRALRWKERVSQQWVSLIPQLLPPKQMATLSGSADTKKWELLDTQLASPLPLHITINAVRTSPTECQLHVRIDSVALPDPSGRTVQLQHNTATQTTVTDKNGQAIFVAIPIADIPNIELRF